MITRYLSSIGPAIANHLWQSTAFAIAAWLVTVLLRGNRAQVRYELWLAASVKFLIPFSLLVKLGSFLPKPQYVVAGSQTAMHSAIDVVSQPFSGLPPESSSVAAHPSLMQGILHDLPAVLLAVWLCGIVMMLLIWYVRWRQVSTTLQRALLVEDGREVEILQRLERRANACTRIAVRRSNEWMEPGIFGIFRPVLIWPEQFSEQLEDEHIEAILAHERMHARRRDNMTAAIHMAVEAVFWFHPIVWWIEKRMVEEREHACDEAVMQEGIKPQIYAESILKACEFCVGSPLACVSGVTGADLKNRVVRIMTHHVAQKLDFRRKLLLGVAGILVIAVPLVFGLQQTQERPAESQTSDTANIPNLKFEVASIKQDKSGEGPHILSRIMNFPNDGRFYATNVSLKVLLGMAYQVQNFQITGGPSWLNSERYDIEATSDSSVNDQLHKLSPDQAKLAKLRMLQSLLADRFQLTLRQETKELPVYALVVAKNGPKLQPTKDIPNTGAPDPNSPPRTGLGFGRGQLSGHGVPLGRLAGGLSNQVGRIVIDKTGLTGNYDFTLQWTPDETQRPMGGGPGNGTAPESQPATTSSDSSGPSIFTALQEQLGLKLESQKGPVEVLAIDHVEQPSAN